MAVNMWRGSISLIRTIVPIAVLICIMMADAPWPVRLALIVGVLSMEMVVEFGKGPASNAVAVRP
jgi:hypothetical protein